MFYLFVAEFGGFYSPTISFSWAQNLWTWLIHWLTIRVTSQRVSCNGFIINTTSTIYIWLRIPHRTDCVLIRFVFSQLCVVIKQSSLICCLIIWLNVTALKLSSAYLFMLDWRHELICVIFLGGNDDTPRRGAGKQYVKNDMPKTQKS